MITIIFEPNHLLRQGMWYVRKDGIVKCIYFDYADAVLAAYAPSLQEIIYYSFFY